MKMKKMISASLIMLLVISVSGCGQTNSPASTSTENNSSGSEKLTLNVLTHRTDRLSEGGDGTLEEMTKSFEEANNCIVKYQGYTDYSSDIPTMMSTNDYGDVLMIPDTVKLSDLKNYFEPLGTYDEISEKYNWADQKMYEGTVYGIPHLGSVAGGICYNKKVWADAGITELPKTPEEFLSDLAMIRDNTDAIPYYTNFAAADWTLVQWASLVVSASGDPAYETNILKNKSDIFAEGGAYYEVYKLMYDIFRDSSLIEEDPMTSDWEGCKAAINNGKIATMVMGSWAVSQFQAAGDNPDDIGYMPAPFSKDGVQYAQSASDYCLGINVHRSDEIKELGKKYIEWFVEDSGFAVKEGAISTVKGGELPDYLDAFSDCVLFTAEPVPEGLVGVWNAIDTDSQVGTWAGDAANFKIQIAEAAFAGKDMDTVNEIFDKANKKWAETRDANSEFNAYLSSEQ